MKIELRNIKIARFASEETDCFEAAVYIDGKRAGTARNDGQGGPNRYHFKDRELERQFHEHCKSLPPLDTEYGPLAMDADLLIGELMQEEEELKQFRRWCKTKTVFRLKGDKEGSYRTLGVPFTAKIKELLAAKHGGRLEEIVNETIA